MLNAFEISRIEQLLHVKCLTFISSDGMRNVLEIYDVNISANICKRFSDMQSYRLQNSSLNSLFLFLYQKNEDMEPHAPAILNHADNPLIDGDLRILRFRYYKDVNSISTIKCIVKVCT